MPVPNSLALKLIESYTVASEESRIELFELRRLAFLDQQSARAQDRLYLSVQDWTLAANAVFDLSAQLSRAQKRLWYELGGPYDASREDWLMDRYRQMVADGEELFDAIASLEAKGRPIEGAEAFGENVRRARVILEDDAIRHEADRLMPPLDKLDALADAHLRSIGE